ncbi:hypothetical protein [Kineococcus indalonis]|uniref:hypothetical protein n=1 Tax=Kineococcus indalonis TaxID=2696566 RepID=UPI001412DC22|nr:hypothetical protein [Kineococcus indalonis]NAZ84562.1 hypothetical protein [Kineococcus indalonis]
MFTTSLLSAIDVTPTQPPGTENISTIIGWIGWIVLAICVIGVLIIAGTLAVRNSRGEGVENASRLGWVLGAAVIVGAAGGIVGAVS